jgi:hypothetical protein
MSERICVSINKEMTDQPNHTHMSITYPQTLSTGNILTILTLAIGLIFSYANLSNTAEAANLQIQEIKLDQKAMETRTRSLEESSIKTNAKLEQIFGLLVTIDDRLKAAEQK